MQCLISIVLKVQITMGHCRFTVIPDGGTAIGVVKPEQNVQLISLHGIDSSYEGQAKDNTLKNIHLQIFPFGQVINIPINNTGIFWVFFWCMVV